VPARLQRTTRLVIDAYDQELVGAHAGSRCAGRGRPAANSGAAPQDLLGALEVTRRESIDQVGDSICEPERSAEVPIYQVDDRIFEIRQRLRRPRHTHDATILRPMLR